MKMGYMMALDLFSIALLSNTHYEMGLEESSRVIHPQGLRITYLYATQDHRYHSQQFCHEVACTVRVDNCV
jgi:hypothetical protein